MYKLMIDSDGIIFTDENDVIWSVPNNPANRHWQEYQAWLEADEDNEPLPAD